MSSYAAQTSRPLSPQTSSYMGSNTGTTTLLAEHRLPRAHLNKSSSDLQIGKAQGRRMVQKSEGPTL